MIAFGPIPTRRLGSSLGINNIPPKYCTYSCIYCQVGKAVRTGTERESLYAPDRICKEVGEKIGLARGKGEHIDYLSFVPDGEPSLDMNLGAAARCLKGSGIPLAIITNGSLLWREDVQRDLRLFDWICIKVDAVSGKTWKRINAPARGLSLQTILEAIASFRDTFNGIFTTETMLVKGINDHQAELEEISAFLSGLHPDVAYLAVPTRPPAIRSVKSPVEQQLNRAYQMFVSKGLQVELLTGYQTGGFSSTGNIREDILSVASVHPIREDGLQEMLQKSDSGWEVVKTLLDEKLLIETVYTGKRFYIRKLK